MKKITLLITLIFSSSSIFSQIVLTEDFEAGLALPSGWTNNDIAGGGDIWTFETGGEAVGYNDPNTIYYTDGLLVGNYAIFDSDGYGNNGIAEDAALESPAFDVSSATNVILSFNHFFTAGYGGQGFVEVYDGSDWVQVASYAGANQDASSFGLEQIDVSSELIGVANAQVRFRFVGDYSWGWALDNVEVTAPSCATPTLSFDDFSSTTVDISTNIVGDFDVEWGVFPYTQGSLTGGTTATITNGDSYQITGLTPGVSYNVFVRQDCGTTDGTSDYAELLVGTSPANVNTFPFSENFEPDANQALLLNLGFSFVGPGTWNFSQDDLADGDTTNDFANSPVSSMFANNTSAVDPADATVFIGPFDLSTSNEYTFSVQQRNFEVSSATRPNKDIELIVATTNDGLNNTVIATFDDMNNITYQLRSGNFTPPSDGEYYFGIRDKSSVLAGVALGNSVFIDDISVTSQALSVDEFEDNNFSHFYDKNLKTLNFESSNLAMSNMEIYSLLGQNVMSKTLSNTTESIDVSSLTDGVYLAKVFVNGNSKTIKFIKN